MGTIQFFIEFVFSFPALFSSPQYLCIDFSLCLFINVYKAFREPRIGKVSKCLAKEELLIVIFSLTLGSISCHAESCSQDMVLHEWAWLKQEKILVDPINSHCSAGDVAESRRTWNSAGLYSFSKTNTPVDDKGNQYALFHIYPLLWAMNFIFTWDTKWPPCLPSCWVESSWWKRNGDVIKPINTFISTIMLFIREMKPISVFI